LPARIGIYLIPCAVVFDFVLYLRGGDYLFPGIGPVSAVLLPLALLLLLGTSFFKLIEYLRQGQAPSLTSPGTQSEPLRLDKDAVPFDPRALASFQSRSRLPVVGLGLIVIAIASYQGYKRWLETRTFHPLTMPVSLAPGHIKTGNFHINLPGDYWVGFDHDYYDYQSNCSFDAPKTFVTWSRDGEKLWEGEGSPWFAIAAFHADRSGYYSLEIDVLSDGSCMNAWHPRLKVWNPSSDYEDLRQMLLLVCCLMVWAGISSIAYSGCCALVDRISPPVASKGYDSIRRPYWPQIARSLPRRFSAPPGFGLFIALTFSWLILFFPAFGPWPQLGIPVSLLRKPLENTDLWTEPLVVYVHDIGPRLVPQLFVNSKPVPWDELRSNLKAELSRRSKWVVYVHSDPNLPWADAVNVMDVARSLQAKVVLLTPQTEPREDDRRRVKK
jgi:biopolymer transport protein ExbD